MADQVPGKAWKVVFCGTAVNLCLGILYAWSVWSAKLIPDNAMIAALTGGDPVKNPKLIETVAGKALQVMKDGVPVPDTMNAGWQYLTNADASTPYMLCILIFALLMIPGGRIQDKMGPKVGAITGGLFLALGCIIAGMSKSYTGLIIGFGIFGGIGMGIGYAAPTPAALSWFGPHKRGLIAGLVVGGYGGAALYVSPLGAWLISSRWLNLQLCIFGDSFRTGYHYRRLPAGQGASGLCSSGGSGKGGRGPSQGGGHHHRLGPVGNPQDLAVLRPGIDVHRHHPIRTVDHRQCLWDYGRSGEEICALPGGQRLALACLWRLGECAGPGGHRSLLG